MPISKSVFKVVTLSLVMTGEISILTSLSPVVLANSAQSSIISQKPNLSGLAFEPPPNVGTPDHREPGGARLKQDWNGFEPPDRGTPGRREPGGSRNTCPKGTVGIQALIPKTTVGRTSNSHPTIFLYIPIPLNQTVKFELDNEEDKPIVSQTYTLKVSSPGIVRFTLPKDPQWEIRPGQNSKWSLSVICDPTDVADSLVVSGWFKGFELNATQQKTVSQGDLFQNLKIYQEEFLWYDTLTTLVNLRSQKTSDVQLRSQWEELLKSVDLEKLSQEPLVDSQWIPQPNSESKSQ